MPGKTVVVLGLAPDAHLDASMRPQRNAGENVVACSMPAARAACFNEAPAKCRGKHVP